ncbi:predicted protein [Arabidopsis lyrata subsp. lyrata]|uniref:Predicted protein n=1 Tax=Arabidopsis lyrata subsp. lyrata TaxID=81972 RepID=D7MEQ5_ARALL|nr:predicted protein [Arabidopsis lyrata subsp. lyrata]
MAKLRANRVVLHNPASRSSNWKRKAKQSRNHSSVMISSTVGGHQQKFGGPNQKKQLTIMWKMCADDLAKHFKESVLLKLPKNYQSN